MGWETTFFISWRQVYGLTSVRIPSGSLTGLCSIGGGGFRGARLWAFLSREFHEVGPYESLFVFVLLVPTIINFIWFSVFGGTALYIERFGDGGLGEPVVENVAMSLNLLLEHLPWQTFMQWSGVLLMVIFFITSSDSGSFVNDMVTSGGNPNPPVANRVFWGVSEGLAAAVLLLAGGLKALQAASISAGLPQSILLILACTGLIKVLRFDNT